MIGLCLISASYVYATNSINVTVTINDSKVAGIGYSVNGKKSGGAGSHYAGKGPRNASYAFGYRKKTAKGKKVDVPCGTHILTKDSQVTLRAYGSKCQSIIGN